MYMQSETVNPNSTKLAQRAVIKIGVEMLPTAGVEYPISTPPPPPAAATEIALHLEILVRGFLIAGARRTP